MKYLARIFGEYTVLGRGERAPGVYYKLWDKYYFWRVARE